MRIATIDVGTNTALLLVAEVIDGRMKSLYEEEQFVRLGEGVDASGRIGEPAQERLRTALLDYRVKATRWGAEPILVGATSASRDAVNRGEVAAFVQRETGLSFEILSGEDEAVWSFRGAASAFDDLGDACIVVDIGGGSTEIVVGSPAASGPEAILYRNSLNAGAVRVTERFFSRQPPAPEEVAAAEFFVEAMLEATAVPTAVPAGGGLPFIGAAGTTGALAIVEEGVASWNDLQASVILPADRVRTWRERLLASSYEEVLALNPEVMSGRADVFPAGVLILDLFMRRLRVEACRVSPRGLRHGLVLRFLERRGGARA